MRPRCLGDNTCCDENATQNIGEPERQLARSPLKPRPDRAAFNTRRFLMLVSGLDEPCGTCGRPSGDHTLREWAHCLGGLTTNLPFEALPADLAQAAADVIREQFGIDRNVIVADHVVVRAAALADRSGGVCLKTPALLQEFQIGVLGRSPATVVTVMLIGGADAMRAYGRLAGDSANAAAEAVKFDI